MGSSVWSRAQLPVLLSGYRCSPVLSEYIKERVVSSWFGSPKERNLNVLPLD